MMKITRLIPGFALLLAMTTAHAQTNPPASAVARNENDSKVANSVAALPDTDSEGPGPVSQPVNPAARFDLHDKFAYYLREAYLNPSAVTAPAFRAGIRMAHPPGHPPTAYPLAWRQGAEAFGRNYGDAFAQRISFHTARFVVGAVVHENPGYSPSNSRNPLLRSFHAMEFAFVDRSDSGHAMPAISNFVGAAAAGFVGNSYLPNGFANVTHAGQRATMQFGFAAAGNLFREFAPQMPRPMRTFFSLIAR